MVSDLRLRSHLQIAVTISLGVQYFLASENTKINSRTDSKVFLFCEIRYLNLHYYSCLFFFLHLFLLQRKILFEVSGHGASKQNYNFKHKVSAT